MKAIILAAGSGRRMRPLSDREHKTLLRIGSKTIISRIVDGLMENGIDRIVIGTGQPSGRPLPGVTLSKAFIRVEPTFYLSSLPHPLPTCSFSMRIWRRVTPSMSRIFPSVSTTMDFICGWLCGTRQKTGCWLQSLKSI